MLGSANLGRAPTIKGSFTSVKRQLTEGLSVLPELVSGALVGVVGELSSPANPWIPLLGSLAGGTVAVLRVAPRHRGDIAFTFMRGATFGAMGALAGSFFQSSVELAAAAALPPDGHIACNVTIDRTAHLGHNVTIGENTTIGADTYVGDDTSIGRNVVVHPRAVIGNENNIADSVRIGEKVVLGHRDVVGANTSLGTGAVLANNVTIASDSAIGPKAFIAEDVRIGSFVVVGNDALVSNGSFLNNGTSIGTIQEVPTPPEPPLHAPPEQTCSL
jgi:UDP-3-O-[3-hydroxymyristoyl] glucosamine N-acyltransferase